MGIKVSKPEEAPELQVIEETEFATVPASLRLVESTYNEDIVDTVYLSDCGFSKSEITIRENEAIEFCWAGQEHDQFGVVQAVNDGNHLVAVPGGFKSGPPTKDGSYVQRFAAAATYCFMPIGVKSSPMFIYVHKRHQYRVLVNHEGFHPDILQIPKHQTVQWFWDDPKCKHAIKEYGFCSRHNGVVEIEDSDASIPAYRSSFSRKFREPGLYFFQTESPTFGVRALSIVHVVDLPSEHIIQVRDSRFKPMMLTIEEGDRVWWIWDTDNCAREHAVFQIECPSPDQTADKSLQRCDTGFKWPTPSKNGLLAHDFEQSGVFFFSDESYESEASYLGVVIVLPKPKQHIVEVTENGFKPDLMVVETGDQIYWKWNETRMFKMHHHTFVMEVERCVANEGTSMLYNCCQNKCQMLSDEQQLVIENLKLQLDTPLQTGVYQYRVANCEREASCCSVIAVPKPMVHFVSVDDDGYKPSNLVISKGDFVCFVWDDTELQHNIIEVSFDCMVIPQGFCSGGLLDNPAGFLHQFNHIGISYYYSQSIRHCIGQIRVRSQPTIVPVYSNEIKYDSTKTAENDVVTWLFRQSVSKDVKEIGRPSERLLQASDDIDSLIITPRRALSRMLKIPGIYHFTTPDFGEDLSTEPQALMYHGTHVSSIVVDPVREGTVIALNQYGFVPSEITILKTSSVEWRWYDTNEEHNIIHVQSPISKEALNAIDGNDAFTSGELAPHRSFYFTFARAGQYWVASQGSPGHTCCITVLGQNLISPMPFSETHPECGLVDYNFEVSLNVDETGAEIYFTADGSYPELSSKKTKKYNTAHRIQLEEPGYVFIRAFAVHSRMIDSSSLITKRYEVQKNRKLPAPIQAPSNQQQSIVDDDNDKYNQLKEWFSCIPIIKSYFPVTGTLEIVWNKIDVKFQDIIRGYQVFLNEISYSPLLSNSVHSVTCSGLAAGRCYFVKVVAYSNMPNCFPMESNVLTMKNGSTTRHEGPLISIRLTRDQDSLCVVWQVLERTDVQGYVVYLNGRALSDNELVIMADGNEMIATIENLNLNRDYKVYVTAELFESDIGELISNRMVVHLPLNMSTINYADPAVMSKFEASAKFEFISVKPGSHDITELKESSQPAVQKKPASKLNDKVHKERTVVRKVASVGTNAPTISGSQRNNQVKIAGPSPRGTEVPPDEKIPEQAGPSHHEPTAYIQPSHASIPDRSFTVTQSMESTCTVDNDIVPSDQKSDAYNLDSRATSQPDEFCIYPRSNSPGVCTSDDKVHQLSEDTGKLEITTSGSTYPQPMIQVKHETNHSVLVLWTEPDFSHWKDRPTIISFVVSVFGCNFLPTMTSHMSYESKVKRFDLLLSGVQHCFHVDVPIHQLVVNGLLTSETYDFEVSAVFKTDTNKEHITKSVPIQYTTWGPPQPPVLKVVGLAKREFSIAWENRGCHSQIELAGYQVYIREQNILSDFPNNINSATLANLSPGVQYTVAVRNVTKRADVLDSDWSNDIILLCPATPVEPEYVTILPPLAANQLTINWPQFHTYSKDYSAIYYNLFVDGQFHASVMAPTTIDCPSFTFQSLNAEKTYDISIETFVGWLSIDALKTLNFAVCQNSSKTNQSMKLHPIKCTAVPRSPSIELENITEQEVSLMWQSAQEYGEAALSGYHLFVNGSLWGSEIGPEQTSIQITGLAPASKISFHLVALTRHAVGQVWDGEQEKAFENCIPGAATTVKLTGFVKKPTMIYAELIRGHRAVIRWKTDPAGSTHSCVADFYLITWRPMNETREPVHSETTFDEFIKLENLDSSMKYEVSVQAKRFNSTCLQENDRFIVTANANPFYFNTISPPGTVKNFHVSDCTSEAFHLQWDPPTDPANIVVGYRLDLRPLVTLSEHYAVQIDIGADKSSTIIRRLLEGTEYEITIVVVTQEFLDTFTAHNDAAVIEPGKFPKNLLFPGIQNLRQWLPTSSITVPTCGTVAASEIKVVSRDQTNISLQWNPPQILGNNEMQCLLIRYIDKIEEEDNNFAKQPRPSVSNQIEVGITESKCSIPSLIPGHLYRCAIEVVVRVKRYLNCDDLCEDKFTVIHVPSEVIFVQTQPALPQFHMMLKQYDESNATIYWQNPTEYAKVQLSEDENDFSQWKVRGFCLLLDGDVFQKFSAEQRECSLLDWQRAGYAKIKQVQMAAIMTKLINIRTINATTEGSGEVTSDENVELVYSTKLKILHFLESKYYFKMMSVLSCEKITGIDSHEVSIEWDFVGPFAEVSHFVVAWKSLTSDVTLSDSLRLSREAKGSNFFITKSNMILEVTVKAILLHESEDTVTSLPSHVQVPGPLKSPEVWLDRLDTQSFSISWGLPQTFGTPTNGFELFINGKQLNRQIHAQQRRLKLSAKPDRVYRVQLRSKSLIPYEYPNSKLSKSLEVFTAYAVQRFYNQFATTATVSGKISNLIPVNIALNEENQLKLEWPHLPDSVAAVVSHYSLIWSSELKPENRVERLEAVKHSILLTSLQTGVRHHFRLLLFGKEGSILQQSAEVSCVTTAPPDAPVVKLKAANLRYITIEWSKVMTYGDALVTAYRVLVESSAVALLPSSQLTYTACGGEWCMQYAYQVQALTSNKSLNSSTSEPLLICWPGIKAPPLEHIPTTDPREICVRWGEPIKTSDIAVSYFMVELKETGEAIARKPFQQSIGPLHSDCRTTTFQNLPRTASINFEVVLKISIKGFAEEAISPILKVQPGIAPEPPQLTSIMIGVDIRRKLEKTAMELLNRRDRLLQLLFNDLVADSIHGTSTYLANVELAELGAALHRIEQVIGETLITLDNYTGELLVSLSWTPPVKTRNCRIGNYRIFVDGHQYGPDIDATVTNTRIKLGIDKSEYNISVCAISELPCIVGPPSNLVNVQSECFTPFSAFCLNHVHHSSESCPNCLYKDSWTKELQLQNRTILCPGQFQVPRRFPTLYGQNLLDNQPRQIIEVSLQHGDIEIDVAKNKFGGKLLSLESTKLRPTLLFIWTPWCVASKKYLQDVVMFAQKYSKYNVVACAYNPAGSELTTEQLKSSLLNYGFIGNFIEHLIVDKSFMEVLAIYGVPTCIFVSQNGLIFWQGRHFGSSGTEFNNFAFHVFSLMYKRVCPVRKCVYCEPVLKGLSELKDEKVKQICDEFALPLIQRPLPIQPFYPPSWQAFDPFLFRNLYRVSPYRVMRKRAVPWAANMGESFTSDSDVSRPRPHPPLAILNRPKQESNVIRRNASFEDATSSSYRTGAVQERERIPWYKASKKTAFVEGPT